MRHLIPILLFLVSFFHLIPGDPATAGGGEKEEVMQNFTMEYGENSREVYSKLDYGREEKVRSLLRGGFSPAKQTDHDRLTRLLPRELVRLIDGEVYVMESPGSFNHYIFFVKNPERWTASLERAGFLSWDQATAEGKEADPVSSTVVIDPEGGIAISLTYWKASPATCAVTEVLE